MNKFTRFDSIEKNSKAMKDFGALMESISESTQIDINRVRTLGRKAIRAWEIMENEPVLKIYEMQNGKKRQEIYRLVENFMIYVKPEINPESLLACKVMVQEGLQDMFSL